MILRNHFMLDATIRVGGDMKRPSMRKAINDMCKSCIYDPIGGKGTWRQQIEACTSKECPLWPLRPISKGTSE